MQYGIAPINDPPLTSHTAGPYAEAAFETHQNEIVTKRNFAVFKNFAASDSKGASAAPELLDLAVTNFDTSEAKAAAIDYFVQNVLPICAADVEAAAIGRAAARVADIAVASGAVYWLKPQTIAQLGQAEFFGSTLPNDTGLLDDLIDSLGKLAALASTSPQIESAMDALRALMPDGEAYSAYANRLAVLRAALPGGNSAIVTGWIRDAAGFDAAQNALEAMAQLVPATHLANFRNVTADALRFRAEDTLKNREAGDSGKTALLFATRILNNQLLANRPGGIVR